MQAEVLENNIVTECVPKYGKIPRIKTSHHVVNIPKRNIDKRVIGEIWGKCADFILKDWDQLSRQERLKISIALMAKAVESDQNIQNNTVVVVKNQELEQITSHIKDQISKVDEEIRQIEDKTI